MKTPVFIVTSSMPLVITSNKETVNKICVIIPKYLYYTFYMRLCFLCEGKEVFIGRAAQEFRSGTNGHRSSFSEKKFDRSALSVQAREGHKRSFLDIFRIAIFSKVFPQILRERTLLSSKIAGQILWI